MDGTMLVTGDLLVIYWKPIVISGGFYANGLTYYGDIHGQ